MSLRNSMRPRRVDALFDRAPQQVGSSTPAPMRDFHLAELLPQNLSYYTYPGSLVRSRAALPRGVVSRTW